MRFQSRGLPCAGSGRRLTIGWGVAVAVALVFACGAGLASAQFREMVDRLPRSANAVVILNVEKAKQSAMGIREGWDKKIETAFQSGLTRVPPKAVRFVLGAEIDFEFMKANWEAAVVEVAQASTLDVVAKAYGGTVETLEGLPALVLPSDAYAVQFGPKTVGAMAPANRQAVVRWVREMRSASRRPLSPYLEKAAGYSDDAGTEIILALDLNGVFALDRVTKYVKSKDVFGAGEENLRPVVELLASMEGVRVGVRIREKPVAAVAVDFQKPVTLAPELLKKVLLEVLADAGATIGDFEQFMPKVDGGQLLLQGELSQSGLRRMLSVVDSPAPPEVESAALKGQTKKGSKASQTPSAGDPVQVSVQYFKSIETFFNDLKKDMGNRKTMASTSFYADKYARKIERMPMLGVDPELLDYGAFVAQKLRQASGSVKGAGIEGGVAQSQVQSQDVYNYGNYGYGRVGYGGAAGGYGTYSRYNPVMDFQYEKSQRRIIRQQVRATTAGTTVEVRQELTDATMGIRRKMTEKYQVEF